MSFRIFGVSFFALCAMLCGTWLAAPLGAQSSASSPTSAETHAELFLVFPFENQTRMPDLDWLGEGLSEVTSERLQDRHLSVLGRQDRLATLERMGLPDSARFSHATMIKIAMEADADAVILGRFQSDGHTVTIEARVLRINPPSLSQPFAVKAPMQEVLRADAHLTWQLLCFLDRATCPPEGANRDESSFAEPPPTLSSAALENFVRGMTAAADEDKLRDLREAARLEPAWDRPAFELGQTYFERHNCDEALVWLSRVPPDRPDGAEASFATGVCHLQRNDAARAEAAFSGLVERIHAAGSQDAIPDLPELHNNLGVARLRLGRWNEAAAEFERAAALEAEEANYWFNDGLAKLAGGQATAAVTPLQQAVQVNPADKEAKRLLAATLDSLGRSDEAASLRDDSDGAAKEPLPSLQDGQALAHLARVSKTVDRAALRAGGPVQPAQPNTEQGAARSGARGETR